MTYPLIGRHGFQRRFQQYSLLSDAILKPREPECYIYEHDSLLGIEWRIVGRHGVLATTMPQQRSCSL